MDVAVKLQLAPDQLGTDSTRDSLAALLAQRSARPVRQVDRDAERPVLRFHRPPLSGQ
ncbi:hypothetical protein [Frondihabitans sp. PAMC 28766]|uniref:hypothetical protein n=1 Tax=Frondihabitans sp. PAMC 28766 TaxID=1795630 RepID=UPI0012FFB91F|nr:hypothetical protein [Frondihabitans sp. PAMC 28766]